MQLEKCFLELCIHALGKWEEICFWDLLIAFDDSVLARKIEHIIPVVETAPHYAFFWV
jgi:hypothetical protein